MQRRTLLKLGVAGTLALGVAGVVAVQWESPLQRGTLSPGARATFRGVGEAMLDACLPAAGADRTAALDGFLNRLELLIQGLPGATQNELAELLSALSMGLGRVALVGTYKPLGEAGVAALQDRLQAMRTSRLAVRQQVYHAFHDLVNSAYFSDSSTWALMGYGGPIKL